MTTMTPLHITHLPAVGHLFEAIGMLAFTALIWFGIRYLRKRWKF